MRALSVVIQESLYSIGKLKSAFLHITQQRPHLVWERNVLGLLLELDDDERLLARTPSSRNIHSVRHGAEDRRYTAHLPPPPQAHLCARGLPPCSGRTKKLPVRWKRGDTTP